jgi:hypothetical protein
LLFNQIVFASFFKVSRLQRRNPQGIKFLKDEENKIMLENNACSSSGCGCSGTTTASNKVTTEKIVAGRTAQKEIEIEFLYLDLNVCDSCKGTEHHLEEALDEVSDVLKKNGVAVTLKKIHVESLAQAEELTFISSPTIRINGRDVALEVKENHCSSCSDLSGITTYCRVWNFQGEEFATVPKPLVIEAVLKEIYGNGNEVKEVSPEQKAQSMENLKRFFDGVKTNENTIHYRDRF